jgi:hypothetical protein
LYKRAIFFEQTGALIVGDCFSCTDLLVEGINDVVQAFLGKATIARLQQVKTRDTLNKWLIIGILFIVAGDMLLWFNNGQYGYCYERSRQMKQMMMRWLQLQLHLKKLTPPKNKPEK